MNKLQSVTAIEILDSRGNPAVMVNVTLNNSITASACVPGGASTSTREAVELHDGDVRRYGGKGVLKAVANVNRIIAPKLNGKSPNAQREIDTRLCKLDGTENNRQESDPLRRLSLRLANTAVHHLGRRLGLTNEPRFNTLHQCYLWAATIGWLGCGLMLVMPSLHSEPSGTSESSNLPEASH